MKEIKTEIIINSVPERVWEILTKFKSYPDWNPFIKSISVSKKVGEQLIVKIHPPDGREMIFRPYILKIEQNKELRWLGKLLFNGLFDGEHYFELVKNHDGTTTFIHGEIFSGILVHLFGKGKALNKTKNGFELMNESIKNECEK